jgi:hypothetical protein
MRVWFFVLMFALGGCGHDQGNWFAGSGSCEEEIVWFAGKCDEAIRVGNYRVIARCVDYPFVLNLHGEVVMSIENEDEFVRYSPMFFDRGVVVAIHQAGEGRGIGASGKGVMFGWGEVWVDGGLNAPVKIRAINPDWDGMKLRGEKAENRCE